MVITVFMVKINLTQKQFSKTQKNKRTRGIKQEMDKISNPHTPQNIKLNTL